MQDIYHATSYTYNVQVVNYLQVSKKSVSVSDLYTENTRWHWRYLVLVIYSFGHCYLTSLTPGGVHTEGPCLGIDAALVLSVDQPTASKLWTVYSGKWPKRPKTKTAHVNVKNGPC